MNNLQERGIIKEFKRGSNLSYIVKADDLLSTTDYKVLVNHENGCFVKCMKIMYNGMPQLFYLTQGYRPLAGLLHDMEPEKFVVVAMDIFRCLKEVRNNGFLSCRNIDIQLDHIFVDTNTYKVYLIYLPLKESFFDDEKYCEIELRSSLIKLILGMPHVNSPVIVRFLTRLQNLSLSVDDSSLTAANRKDSHNSKNGIPESEKKLKLITVNLHSNMEFTVDKEEYILGRSLKTADGIIRDNKMVGREHCRIISKNHEFYLEDLKSTNGTFLNQVRLQPGVIRKLQNGDVLRLANVDIRAVID